MPSSIKAGDFGSDGREADRMGHRKSGESLCSLGKPSEVAPLKKEL